MIGQIIAWGIILVVALMILYNLYSIYRVFTDKSQKKEDRTYKAKKNLYDFLMTFLRNFRKFLDFGQVGKAKVDPMSVAFASVIDHAVNNLNQADPALIAKKQILKQIEDTVKVLESALDNAVKHRSLEAKTYVGDCYQELKSISASLGQQETFSEIRERIETIREHAQSIAEAPTFDDAGSDSGDDQDPGHHSAPSAPKKTYYEILGISRDASQDEIKRVFRDLANKYHPDKYEHLADDMKKEAGRRFTEINEAYQVLSNPQKRADYDQQIG